MADEEEKTEEPTGKKISDAKSKGNVPKSMEVVGASVLFFGSLYLLFFSSHLLQSIKKTMLFTFSFIDKGVDTTVIHAVTHTVVTTILYSLLPIFALVLILTFVTNWAQFGFVVNPMKFDLMKLNPISGLKNIFGLKKALESLKLMAKLAIIIIVMVILFLVLGDYILAMMDKGINASIESIIELTGYFLAAILLIVIIFAIIDFYFTRYYYFKSLRMSKQEVKDEFKNMDGDPMVKGRIKRVQMEMAKKRMMGNVSEADVVITNPTHYAVALKYDSMSDEAPVIVAKGIDFLAAKIKEIALDNDIPIIENPPLARALYAQIEVDQQIPEEFYKAIADIFSYIYELKSKSKS
jgi:flagellar biosynthetic protein FlhB